jgi:hypothetical protein
MKRLIFVAIMTVGCASEASWADDTSIEQPGSDASIGKDASVQQTKDGGTTQTQDAGPSDAQVVDDTNYNTANVCTSGQTWTGGTSKSANMEPGLACRSCHVVLGQAGTKDFDISGTVYPTAHEPDLCNGVSGGMTVVITDANKNDHVLQVNAAGNFYNDDALGFLKIPTPYTAKVVAGNQVREMISAQTSGDCNSCHTEQGASMAPGRIALP